MGSWAVIVTVTVTAHAKKYTHSVTHSVPVKSLDVPSHSVEFNSLEAILFTVHSVTDLNFALDKYEE